MPGQESLRRNDRGNLLEPAQTEPLRLLGQASPLIIAEPHSLLALQLPEHTNVLLKVFDDVLLLPVLSNCTRPTLYASHFSTRDFCFTPEDPDSTVCRSLSAALYLRAPDELPPANLSELHQLLDFP
jgi:hypothetical protein